MSRRAFLTLLLLACGVHAELPLARLQSIFPPGGQTGSTLEVKVEGADLDDATALRFSAPGIVGEHHPTNATGAFLVNISSNVPPGLYEARVLGRFGLSNPRFFTVGTLPEMKGDSTNRTASTALAIPTECTVNALATASAADFYRVEVKAGGRLFVTCRGEPFDSKMQPRVLLYDSEGNELLRDRSAGALEFHPSRTGTFHLKVHDEQFRGGLQFAYRLTITAQPDVEFIFPAARMPGADRPFTAFGPGVPKKGERLEITVPQVADATNASHAFQMRRLAECGLSTFQYRAPKGVSNPVELSIATAPAVLEQEPNNDPGAAQKISVPCEIQGQFFPKSDIDMYEFSAKKGDVFTIEVFSERLGLPTDPFVLVQKISTNASGGEVASDLQEMYDSEPNLGGPLFDTSSRDPSWRLEVPEDGRFRVQIRDLFNHRADPSRIYRLSIRRESPDFRLIAAIAAPPSFEKDKREALVWSPFLRRNDTILLKVLALRRDNFKGEIALEVEGAPPGVRASASVIPEGQSSTWLTLSSDDKAADWSGAIRITGKAKVGGTELIRRATAATIVWDVPDYNNETVKARLAQETTLALSAELAPFRIESTNSLWQVAQGATLSIPWSVARVPEFKEPVKLRAYIDTQNDPIREWDLDGQAAQANLELDLKQTKVATGTHQLFLLAQTKGKIRRVRADEVTVLEAAEKATKDEAEKKRLQERLKLQDVTAIFPSPLLKLVVNPAPTAAK